MEAFQTLVKIMGEKYRDQAFRCIQELSEKDNRPEGMSVGLYQRFTLMRHVGMSPQEAQDFLGRYYDA